MKEDVNGWQGKDEEDGEEVSDMECCVVEEGRRRWRRGLVGNGGREGWRSGGEGGDEREGMECTVEWRPGGGLRRRPFYIPVLLSGRKNLRGAIPEYDTGRPGYRRRSEEDSSSIRREGRICH